MVGAACARLKLGLELPELPHAVRRWEGTAGAVERWQLPRIGLDRMERHAGRLETYPRKSFRLGRPVLYRAGSGLRGVAHEDHGGDGTDSAGYRRQRGGGGAVWVDVAGQSTVRGLVPTSITTAPGFDVLGADEVGAAGGGDEHVRLGADGGEVDASRERVWQMMACTLGPAESVSSAPPPVMASVRRGCDATAQTRGRPWPWACPGRLGWGWSSLGQCRPAGAAGTRCCTSGVARARQVSRAAWLTGRGWMSNPPASHLESIRSLTPRCAANSRTLERFVAQYYSLFGSPQR